MKKNQLKKTFAALAAVCALSLTACTSSSAGVQENNDTDTAALQETETTEKTETKNIVTSVSVSKNSVLETADMFTERDLTQTADLTEAKYYTASDGETVTISEAGVYVFSGTAENYMIYVEAGEEDKVQIVLDGLSVTNESTPVICVASADKVFVTTTDNSENTLKTAGEFAETNGLNTDGVIFSKDDVVINGLGTLTIESSDNGIVSKDELKVTGGTLNITCAKHGLEAHDGIAVADGMITINTDDDALHAEDDDDDSVGYVYIAGGTLNIKAGDDAIHATTVLEIDGGTVTVDAHEGLEGTYVIMNDGLVTINASDDGINAAQKSSAYTPIIEINGGELNITMAQGDTDALDSNGYLYINGGTVNINAQFAFDFVLGAELNGGTVIVNGEEVSEITESMMMGGPNGGMTGGPNGGMTGGPSMDENQQGPGNETGGGFPGHGESGGHGPREFH